MNASLVSRLDDITVPLGIEPAPPPSGAALLSARTRTDDAISAPWPPGVLLGNRYRIGRVIETGGMATVYEATQIDLVRRVAIKVPTAKCVANSLCARSFEREARTLAGLQHSHIVSVIEFGRSQEGVPFMAMELVEGPTLRTHLARGGTLRWRTAALIAAQLADALDAVHASGVVHGDVSAANVLLAQRGDAFASKLIDFGAARRIGAGDLSHRTYGTERYVAPELLDGEAPHIASDLYALGALLGEMLGAAPPDTVPQSLRQLLASMLEANPDARPESAAEVLARLREALGSLATAPPHVAVPLCADPRDAPLRVRRVVPPSRRLHGRWLVAALIGAAGLFALVTYRHQEMQGTPGMSTDAAIVATPKLARVVPRPPGPVAIPAAVSSVVAPVAMAQPRTVLVSAHRATPAPMTDAADYELLRDESLERLEIVASLDRWFNVRNRNVSKERVPVIAMRVGKPSIVFDPSGTSASVTYRKRLVYSRANRTEQSVIEEQVFFAKLGETWQMVNPDSG